MSFELEEEYALKPEVIVPPHDISKGLQRHMPIAYAESGSNRAPDYTGWLSLAFLGAAGLVFWWGFF